MGREGSGVKPEDKGDSLPVTGASRPVLLDLFCKAGGCTKGYQRAGFYVVGVDIEPQPNYCGDEFVQADALDVLDSWDLGRFDAVHASPPCHDHSNVTGRDRKAKGDKGTGWMLAATIDVLRLWTRPWVVENVEAADMPAGAHRVRLCGSSFGLDVRRHRLFASNVALMVPPCDHSWQTPRFRSLAKKQHEAGKLASVVGVHGHLNYAGEREVRERAMDIDWMTPDELAQAIPPAYTEHIGAQLLAMVSDTRSVA